MRRATNTQNRHLTKHPQFLSTLSLRRATHNLNLPSKPIERFLSTLSLRRATARYLPANPAGSYFYPRSPCGERLEQSSSYNAYLEISIHALLAESDFLAKTKIQQRVNFYPRSPCGERLITLFDFPIVPAISIHALLAESDTLSALACSAGLISIHALLAESDRGHPQRQHGQKNFYPRSPCGERRRNHAKCALNIYFYPRSPCGERLLTGSVQVSGVPSSISIHALLAESDFDHGVTLVPHQQFLSTLSLRRATLAVPDLGKRDVGFLSTLSLRRATSSSRAASMMALFLSTLSLRRAT